MRSITTILRGLQDKPQLVTKGYATSVLEALERKDLSMFEKGSKELSSTVVTTESKDSVGESKSSAILLEIDGGLTYKPTPCTGLNSYNEIQAVFTELVAQGHKIIGFDMSSPGGQAYRCFATARAIRQIADEHDVKIISYIDVQAESAGYALVAVSDEIVANPMASVGSIGAIISIKNDMPKEIADGKERLFITDKGSKSPFEETGHIKQGVIDKLQEEVSSLGQSFDEHVSEFRNIPLDEIKKMNAESFNAEKALSLGLIDKVMEREDFLSYLSTVLHQNKQKENVQLLENTDTSADLASMLEVNSKLAIQLQELTDKFTATESHNSELSSALEGVLSKRKEEATEELATKLTGFTFISNAKEMAVLLETLSTDSKALFLTVFDSASELITKVEKDTKLESETEEMFELSSQQDDDVNTDVYTSASDLLKAKHQKGEK